MPPPAVYGDSCVRFSANSKRSIAKGLPARQPFWVVFLQKCDMIGIPKRRNTDECRKNNAELRDNIEKTAMAIINVLEKMESWDALERHVRIFLREYEYFSMDQYLKLLGMMITVPGISDEFLYDVAKRVREMKPENLQENEYFQYEQLMYHIAIILESRDRPLAMQLLQDTYQYRLQWYGEHSLLTLGCEMELILCRAQNGQHRLALEQLEKLYAKVTQAYNMEDITLAKAIRSNIDVERAILANEDQDRIAVEK